MSPFKHGIYSSEYKYLLIKSEYVDNQKVLNCKIQCTCIIKSVLYVEWIWLHVVDESILVYANSKLL
jgi:hypothetical protein